MAPHPYNTLSYANSAIRIGSALSLWIATNAISRLGSSGMQRNRVLEKLVYRRKNRK